MTQGAVLQLAQGGIWVMLLLALPILGVGLAVGLVVSLLQATTQINEQTLSFLPKLLAMLAAVVVLGPWMLTVLVDFARHLLLTLPRWS